MEQRYNYTDWDDSVYGTGRTEPPKHRSGLLAMMLILIIFLCGIITVLGVLNVKLCKISITYKVEIVITVRTFKEILFIDRIFNIFVVLISG